MTIDHYKLSITANVNKLAVEHLVNELAAVAAERDQLKARVTQLEAQDSAFAPQPVLPATS